MTRKTEARRNLSSCTSIRCSSCSTIVLRPGRRIRRRILSCSTIHTHQISSILIDFDKMESFSCSSWSRFYPISTNIYTRKMTRLELLQFIKSFEECSRFNFQVRVCMTNWILIVGTKIIEFQQQWHKMQRCTFTSSTCLSTLDWWVSARGRECLRRRAVGGSSIRLKHDTVHSLTRAAITSIFSQSFDWIISWRQAFLNLPLHVHDMRLLLKNVFSQVKFTFMYVMSRMSNNSRIYDLNAIYSTRHLLCIKTPLKHMGFWCTINDAYCS